MKSARGSLVAVFAVVMLAGSLLAQQQPANASSSAVVPRVVNYSGKALDSQGRAISGVAGVTIAIYQDQSGAAPLWIETQNVEADAKGNYTVALGATKPAGIPLELFASGEARWLGVRINGGAEQARVLLLSVPYALKAADAQTLGGLPASAFVLATPVRLTTTDANAGTSAPVTSAPPPSSNVTTSGGATGTLALWDSASDIKGSAITQTGSGAKAKIGINTTTPVTPLDIKGAVTVRGALNLPTTGNATASAGKSSQAESFTASAYNSSKAAAVPQKFQWQAEPTGNNTASPAGTLNLLFASAGAAPTETGLQINDKGLFTFAAGQTFPGTGTILGVNAGTDLTGGGSAGTLTLNLDTTKVPQLKAGNTFVGNQTVNGNLSTTGVVAAGSYEIGSNLFAFGTYANQNAFLGFAGNTTTTGAFNTASGWQALLHNTTGLHNAAHGTESLQFNTTGSGNTAVGSQSLQGNGTGNYNTASGAYALVLNTTGSDNTASGFQALYGNIKGTDNTATGYQALYYNKGSGNTAVGSQALQNTYIASYNTGIGYQALNANSSGSQNTASGYQALYSNTTAVGNTANGYQALFANTTGYENAANGFQALYSNTTGYQNTATGYQALYSNVGPGNVVAIGIGNTADGYQALYANSTGTGNTATGAQALSTNTDGVANTAVGYQALSTNTSSQNTAVGYQALYTNGNGIANTAVGMYALQANSDGAANTAIGRYALAADTEGANSAVGYDALASNTTGSGNTAVGFAACGSNTTGSDVTCVGVNTNAADSLSNATAIGAHAIVAQSNSLVLGGIGEHGVKVGIGVTAPSNVLTIGRGLGHPVSDSWETYSSRRWKTNIETLPNALQKVQQLRGVSYDLKDSGKHEIGVIAEEVGAVVPEVVTFEKNGTDAQGVDYGRLTALLIEAVKQQQKLITAQQEQMRRLRSKHAAIESTLIRLQAKMDQLRQAKGAAMELAADHSTVTAKKQF
jgi:hypothetical protein